MKFFIRLEAALDRFISDRRIQIWMHVIAAGLILAGLWLMTIAAIRHLARERCQDWDYEGALITDQGIFCWRSRGGNLFDIVPLNDPGRNSPPDYLAWEAK